MMPCDAGNYYRYLDFFSLILFFTILVTARFFLLFLPFYLLWPSRNGICAVAGIEFRMNEGGRRAMMIRNRALRDTWRHDG